jgi:hypothetical protein
MKLRTALQAATLVFGTFACGVALVYGDFAEMTRRVPRDANVIMYMDVERLMASPMAAKQDWKGKQAADYHTRPFSVPPAVTRFARAASVNVDTNHAEWQIAILEAKSVPPLETIAKNEKGYVDTVAGTKAVWSPRGAYAIQLPGNSLGLMFPANRQYLSRWIKDKSGQTSSYLTDAARDMTATGPQLVLALDLEDVVQPDAIRDRLNDVEAIKGSKTNIDAIAKTLATIRGVKLAVTVTEKASGKITVDFAADAAVLKNEGKALLLHALQNHGLALEDLDSWTGSVNKNAFVLEGELSRSGLMRLSSLLDFPSLPLDDSGRDAEQVDAGNPMLYATQSHFKGVVALLEDLNEKRKEFQNPGHAAGWWETYAKRVDRLPTVNVDPDMLAYSAEIAELLRTGAEQFRGAGIRTGVREANQAAAGPNYGYGYGYVAPGYGYRGDRYAGARQAQADRNAIRAQETGQAAMTGVDIRKQIQDATSAIKRKMTDRYKVQF